MNYTQTNQALEIIRLALDAKSADERRLFADRLTERLNVRKKEALKHKDTPTTWRTTDSEWEFIHVTEVIADALKSDGDTRESLSATMEMLNQRMPPLRVAFFAQEFFLWPSFQTIWEYMNTLENVEATLIYVYSNGAGVPLKDEKYLRNIEEYREAGYPIIEMEEYDLTVQSPDLVFYMKPYLELRGCPPKFFAKEVSQHTPYTAFVSYCMDVQGGSVLVRYFYAMPAFFYMWRIIGYSQFYMDMIKRYGFRNAENAVLIGHPKFDCTHKALVERAYQHEDWKEKIAGRPVLLWNTHFTIEEGQGVGTYLVWKDMMFEYFEHHHDIVLLWRPHPIFWESIRKHKGFNEEEFSAFLEELRSRDNVIVDDTSDYRYAFSMSDALVSDAATFLVEFGATGLPVLYTEKAGGEFIINEDYLSSVETATDAETITAFLERVRRRDTSDQEDKRNRFEEMFGKCDGNNGRRIGEYLLGEMEADCVDRAKRMIEREN